MKLIMPMAGLGSRFDGDIKPLIDVGGVPMFVHSERCFGIDFEQHIFITRREHNLRPVIKEYYPDAVVIEIDYTTQGTACTIKLASVLFEDGSSIMVSNCDQHVEWDKNIPLDADAAVAVFHDPEMNPKWSFAQMEPGTDNVVRVAEKDPISEWATVGWYYWKDGRNFLSAVDDMIAADDRVNNEFYTCPVLNYNIKRGHRVVSFNVDKMQGIGIPEDLDKFLKGGKQ